MGYRWILLLLICIFTSSAANDEEEHKKMVKRQVNSLPLVFPYGGIYKLVLGISAPIKAEDYISLAFAANFQYQYGQFQNISQLSQYYFIKTVSREQREADIAARRDERLTFYRSVAEMLRTKGMDGEECVLRAICEAAQYPVEEEGLVGEILHILLTPDYGKSPFDEVDPVLGDLMSPYNDAAVAGRQMFNCPSIYPRCPEGQGVMEMFSVLREEPDYGKSPFDEVDPVLGDLMSPYNDAAVAGRQMFNCPSIYPRCPEGQGVMEMFSVLREE